MAKELKAADADLRKADKRCATRRARAGDQAASTRSRTGGESQRDPGVDTRCRQAGKAKPKRRADAGLSGPPSPSLRPSRTQGAVDAGHGEPAQVRRASRRPGCARRHRQPDQHRDREAAGSAQGRRGGRGQTTVDGRSRRPTDGRRKDPRARQPAGQCAEPPPSKRIRTPSGCGEDKPAAEGGGTKRNPAQSPGTPDTGGAPGVGQVGNGKPNPSVQDTTAGRVPPAPPKVPTSGNGQDTSPTQVEPRPRSRRTPKRDGCNNGGRDLGGMPAQ